MANFTNHPPRKGLYVTPSKGGRNTALYTRLTEDEASKVRASAERLGLSLADWMVQAEKIMTNVTTEPPAQSGTI